MRQPKPAAPFTPADLQDDEDEAPLPLPPGARAVEAAAPVAAAPELKSANKVVLLIGAGRSGKTTMARWLAERAHEAERPLILAAADPLNRSLTNYYEGVAQPMSNDPTETARWLESLFGYLMASPGSAVIDLGGGDVSLATVLRGAPDLPEMMEGAGLSLVPFYLAGPRIDDLTAITSMETLFGFRPQARALVLNEGLGEPGMSREEAFGRVLRHSAYRKAVDGGAVPLWLPRIAGNAAAEVEARRISFAAARDGNTPEGRKVTPLGPFDRARLRNWLAAMDREFAPVRSWLP